MLGVFAAHTAPSPRVHGGVAAVLLQAPHGRATALFVLLAGVGMALISGGRRPHEGRRWRRTAARLAQRAVLLSGIGLALEALNTGIAVILTSYGLYFLLGIPLLRRRTGTLLTVAGLLLTAGPLISFAVRHFALRDAAGGGRIGALLFTGGYPAAAWMGLVVAGIAIGRMDLRPAAHRMRLAGAGAGLAVLGYGGSWLALHVLGGAARLAATPGPGGRPLGADGVAAVLSRGSGVAPSTDPAWLLAAAPHGGGPFEAVGSLGVALLILAAALVAADHARVGCTPLIAVGAMSLTAYAGHIVVIFVAHPDGAAHPSAVLFLSLTAAALTAGALWRRHLGQGPLERLLKTAAEPLTRAIG